MRGYDGDGSPIAALKKWLTSVEAHSILGISEDEKSNSDNLNLLKVGKEKVDKRGSLKYLQILGKLIAPRFASKRGRNL